METEDGLLSLDLTEDLARIPSVIQTDSHGEAVPDAVKPTHSLAFVGALKDDYAVFPGQEMESDPTGSYGEKFDTAHDSNEPAAAAGLANNSEHVPNLSELESASPLLISALIPAGCSLANSVEVASLAAAVSDLSIVERDAAAKPSLSVAASRPHTRQHLASDYDEYTDFHKKLKLRPYQEEVIQRSLRGENDIILLPTGAGKTYVAIKVIIEHLYRLRNDKPKVVFLVPTAVLATQQLKKIEDHMAFAWDRKTCKVTGETNMPAEHLRQVIQGDEYVLLVVTPAIISNYLAMWKESSLSEFTLLIFDEYHHAKKDHPYNDLIRKCLELQSDNANSGSAAGQMKIPQLLGLTATIGIGDSKDLEKAKRYIIEMCAKFGLQHPPSESAQIIQTCQQTRVEEAYDIVDYVKRRDKLSQYIETKLMAVLEDGIATQLSSPLFKASEVVMKPLFPEDKHAQIYESFVVNLSNTVTGFHANEELREPVTYCMVALKHLLVYYKTLQLIDLLSCEHGIKYLTEQESKPGYQSVDEVWTLFTDNREELKRLQADVDHQSVNEKIQNLRHHLIRQFRKEQSSKVIIFVQRRVVAQYMADLLNSENDAFRAKEFTSTGPSVEESGMNPQQRIDAREGFEGDKYNILVSTSVLEEGIDIQACNMVVRYMYVKDMIAKIQTRGRARDVNGVMIALLDTRLAQQEERNNFKEKLMYKALQAIRDMPEQEFKAKVDKQLKHMTPVKAPPPRVDRGVTDKAKISCKVCGFALGHMTDVRQFGKSHFLIIDGSLCDRVTPYPDKSGMKPMDGMVPYGKLLCAGKLSDQPCSSHVGTLVRMSSGQHFGMWRIKGISVNNIPLKKYKDVTEKHGVQIHPIDMVELAGVGPDNQFPPHLLEEGESAEPPQI